MARRVILIIGEKGAGKTKIARYIRQTYGGRIMPLAEPVYDYVSQITGHFVMSLEEAGPTKDAFRPLLRDIAESTRHHLPLSPFACRIRHLLANDNPHCTDVIVPDVRRQDELEILRTLEALDWEVLVIPIVKAYGEHDPQTPEFRKDSHPSEIDVRDLLALFPDPILNNGTLEDLYRKVDTLFSLLESPKA